jgi:hypothetical protein
VFSKIERFVRSAWLLITNYFFKETQTEEQNAKKLNHYILIAVVLLSGVFFSFASYARPAPPENCSQDPAQERPDNSP